MSTPHVTTCHHMIQADMLVRGPGGRIAAGEAAAKENLVGADKTFSDPKNTTEVCLLTLEWLCTSTTFFYCS